ncbi:redoxin domain-containing protein [Corallococcus caeni]|uniref:redoxin domain-containing protein n=1 Tax=Corallococcus caeni TaxID=3082388 RepID=UPI002955EEE2|nr:redoxin domain-containing protein [Corallococcus sp. KH5-1]
MATLAPPPPASGILVHGLPPGTRAPEWDAPSTPDGRRIKLADQRGSPVVLVFYPGDFTPVCTGELGLYNELLPEFGQFGAKVFGISCDSLWSHIAFAKELHIQIPLLSDFHPKGELSRRYNVYREDAGICERALYVIDGKGDIYWSHVSPIEINPGADGVIDALERLSGKQMEVPTFQPQQQPSLPEART